MEIVILIYCFLGIGILGGCHKWTHVGWAYYSIFFPIHATLISFATSFAKLTKFVWQHETLRNIVVFIALLYLFLMLGSR